MFSKMPLFESTSGGILFKSKAGKTLKRLAKNTNHQFIKIFAFYLNLCSKPLSLC